MMMLQLFRHIYFIIPTMLYFLCAFLLVASTNNILIMQINAINADIVQWESSEKSNQQSVLYPVSEKNDTEIIAQKGGTTYLPCKVSQLGNKSITWVRLRDQHVIAVDKELYITDGRFTTFFKNPFNQWTLQLKFVNERDSGLYECAVAVEPKVSARVNLKVIVPMVKIVGDSDRYVKAGSNITITCLISNALDLPHYVIWYRDVEKILPDNVRGIKMELKKMNGTNPMAIATLTIPSTKKSDSGNFTCNPPDMDDAIVALHVINSAESASAVTSSASTNGLYKHICGFVLLVVLMNYHT